MASRRGSPQYLRMRIDSVIRGCVPDARDAGLAAAVHVDAVYRFVLREQGGERLLDGLLLLVGPAAIIGLGCMFGDQLRLLDYLSLVFGRDALRPRFFIRG